MSDKVYKWKHGKNSYYRAHPKQGIQTTGYPKNKHSDDYYWKNTGPLDMEPAREFARLAERNKKLAFERDTYKDNLSKALDRLETSIKNGLAVISAQQDHIKELEGVAEAQHEMIERWVSWPGPERNAEAYNKFEKIWKKVKKLRKEAGYD